MTAAMEGMAAMEVTLTLTVMEVMDDMEEVVEAEVMVTEAHQEDIAEALVVEEEVMVMEAEEVEEASATEEEVQCLYKNLLISLFILLTRWRTTLWRWRWRWRWWSIRWLRSVCKLFGIPWRRESQSSHRARTLPHWRRSDHRHQLRQGSTNSPFFLYNEVIGWTVCSTTISQWK